ncbi:MAG TPA: cyclic-di-AMP receptor [Caldisericia bacterium]|nr:cyclic-di-AMP receptor [Caldisericia bacterium]HPF49075.1 cyclic-di-AMP receptor [Caldisericia bacterium]HPI83061.1 cyclic-di-AMP receptor [Caldisericia bacterium]HPQ92288.1 cyclic-di-AMP receptor [Caldisericia bacterium]HRV74614.1 cyclic-di-AMP receptor [Caldisericia bacterium]
MKLVVAIVQQEDSTDITTELLQNGYKITKLKGYGGFLEEGNVVLMLGVEDTHVTKVIQIFKGICTSRDRYINALPFVPLEGMPPLSFPVKVSVGGAKIFVLPVDEFHVL